MRDRLVQYALLMRLDKPIGALLLLWPMLWVLWIAAEGWPDPLVLVVFVVGVFVMRSAGCIINDYADRDYDPHVERTRERPIAAGRVSSREALGLFVAVGTLAFALVLLMNPLTIKLSFVGILLAASYPFHKRYTYVPQVHLGFAFGWAVPMGYAAQTGTLEPIAWLVMLSAVIWAVVYDTIYAMVDRDDDLLVGIKSTAILVGTMDRAFVGAFQLLMLVSLALVGQQAALGAVYYAGVGLGTGLFVYQQFLIRHRDRTGCFRAFLNNNWFGAVIFAGIVGDYLARGAG
jgi:4-hydroxybenzoate polyprenyltransferase